MSAIYSSESSAFPYAIYKCKYKNVQNYKFTFCFEWV
jgi:hypothetical protein